MKQKESNLFEQKVIRSGQMLEVYTYKTKQVKMLLSDERVLVKEQSIANEEEKKERTEEYQRRAKKNFRRLIEANAQLHKERDKFLTMTYKENMKDRGRALKDFRNFLKKARRKYGKFEYVAVIEYQQRGAIHFHCFLFKFPFVPRNELSDLANVWGHGAIDLQVVKDHFKMTNYLTKYFMKTFEEEKDNNERRYFASKGLKRSQEYLINNVLDFEKLGHELFDYDFYSRYVGDVCYKKIRLYVQNKDIELEKIINEDEATTES